VPPVRSVVRRLARAVGRARAARADGDPGLAVRLLGNGDVPSPLDEVDAILEVLRRAGRVRLDALVREAAEALYRSELARGGANVDLGLFGPGIFVPEIRRVVDASHGRLWEIAAMTEAACAGAEAAR